MLRAHFQWSDWAILGAYVVFLLVAGFWPRRQDAKTYMIADRNLSLPVFVATLVATWYGGILGSGEFSYDSGLVGWTTNGLPYYVFGIVFALLLAPRVRRAGINVYTIPDKLAAAYDRKTALLGAALTFIYAAPATYVLMIGILLQILFGWKLLPAMIVGLIFSIIYVFRGGFLADVRVNSVQFLLMFAGFAAMTALCLTRFGGFGYLSAPGRLPPDHLRLLGGYGLGFAIAWFFIALTTLADPGFHQRCYAARTPRIASAGILVAVVCWMVFDALANTTGLFARAVVPGLSNGMLAYPALAERILPPTVKGLFYTGMLAPMMASTVSYTFISAMTVGRDFIWRLRRETAEDRVPAYTRVGLAVTSAAALIFAIAIPSVVRQWYFFGSILVPGVLIPLLGAYAPNPRWRARPSAAFWSMAAGAATSLAWLIAGWKGSVVNPSFPLGWQPMFPGLAVAAIVYAAGLPRTRRGTEPDDGAGRIVVADSAR